MTPGYKLLIVLIALIAAASCHTNRVSTSKPIDVTFTPRYATWVAIMEHVMDPNYHDILRAEVRKGEGSMNLQAIANAAEESANYVALGYGIHQMESVEDFGEIARSAELWLREISAQARRGERAGLRELIEDGETKYCDRCHDAAG